jgi:hypothetical protein
MRIIRTKGTTIIAFCIIAIFLAIGCAATKKITEDLVGGGKALKKKAVFLPAVNKTEYGGKDFQESARAHLKTSLKRFCDDLIIIDSRKIQNLLEKIPRLPSGQFDHLALAKFGRLFGLNAVLEESLSEIECVTDKRGIWGFRNTCMLVQLSVCVRAYDIETGAILFDEVVNDEVEVLEHDWQDIEERRGYHKEIADRLLSKTTAKIYKRICELLGNEPWKGYITSVSENTFALIAGKDVGLAIGDVLEVFGTSDPIEGQAGQFYLVSGSKIGELRITKVQGNRAEAIGILGSDLQKSSHVKFKLKR